MTETPGDFEIPEEAVEKAAGELHGFEHDRLQSICPGSDYCQLWYDAEIRAAWLLSALPHLRVQETPDAEACDHDWREYWDGSLGYGATDSCTRCGAYRPTPEPRPVVDREAVWRALYEVWQHPKERPLDFASEGADAIVALLPTEAETKAPQPVEELVGILSGPIGPKSPEWIASVLGDAETKALAETATELGRRVGRKEAGEEIATAFLNYMTNDILGRADISVDRAVAMVREICKGNS